jgi:hypothetical protein
MCRAQFNTTKIIKQKNIGNIKTYKNHEQGFAFSKHCKREDKCMISSSLECETTLRVVGMKDMVNRMKVLQEKKTLCLQTCDGGNFHYPCDCS